MAKDYTKYSIEGLGENLNKRKLVFSVVKDWVGKNKPSFEELQKVFPDEVQGSKGFIRKESDVKDAKRFNMREPLTIKNGVHVVVSNQWGKNIGAFIEIAQQLGYNITQVSASPQIENDYFQYFKDQNFKDNNFPIQDFIDKTEKVFDGLSYENEQDHNLISALYDQLSELVDQDGEKYGGYLYLFTQIAEFKGEGEYDIWFDWDVAVNYGCDWSDMINTGENTVHYAIKKVGKDEFDTFFPSIFLLTLLKIIDDASHEEIAEFIVSNDVSAYREALGIDEDGEDVVSDIVIVLLRAIGYDISDYEGECTVNGFHFLNMGYDMGYDYVRLAEDFRDSNI